MGNLRRSSLGPIHVVFPQLHDYLTATLVEPGPMAPFSGIASCSRLQRGLRAIISDVEEITCPKLSSKAPSYAFVPFFNNFAAS